MLKSVQSSKLQDKLETEQKTKMERQKVTRSSSSWKEEKRTQHQQAHTTRSFPESESPKIIKPLPTNSVENLPVNFYLSKSKVEQKSTSTGGGVGPNLVPAAVKTSALSTSPSLTSNVSDSSHSTVTVVKQCDARASANDVIVTSTETSAKIENK